MKDKFLTSFGSDLFPYTLFFYKTINLNFLVLYSSISWIWIYQLTGYYLQCLFSNILEMFLTIAPCMRETTLEGGSYIKAQAYMQKDWYFLSFSFYFLCFHLVPLLHMLLKSKTKLDASGASWINVNKENLPYFTLHF